MVNDITTIFFNKYFNNNIQDDDKIESFISTIPENLYVYAHSRILDFIKTDYDRVQYDKFAYKLYLEINKLWQTSKKQ
jgi:hypothetical protein